MIFPTPFSLEDAPPLLTEPAPASATLPPTCPTYAAAPADRPLSETPLFAESFEGGALPIWVADGAWMLEGGRLSASTEHSAVRAAVSDALADLVVRLTLRVETGSAGIEFRRSAFGLYRLLASADGGLTLERAGVLLCRAALAGSMGESRSVYVRAAGGRITAALDGVIVLDIFDPAALPAGGLALAVDPFSRAAFDEVSGSRLADAPLATPTPSGVEATEESTVEAIIETPTLFPDSIASTTQEILYDFTQGASGFVTWGTGTPQQPTAGQGWYGGLTGRTTGNIKGLAIRLTSSVPVTVVGWSADVFTTNGWSMALYVDGVGPCNPCGRNDTGERSVTVPGAARTGRLIEVHLYNHHGVGRPGALAATYILRRLRIRYQVLPTPTPTMTPTLPICSESGALSGDVAALQACPGTPTPTATSITYSCRVRPNPNTSIYGYETAEEAVSSLTTPTPPISFSQSDVLRVDRRASLYANVVRVESESAPGIWYWIDSGAGVTLETGANCDQLPVETSKMYAVRIISDGTRTWDVEGTTQYPDYGNRFFERQSIITALDQVGMAFNTLASTADIPQEAFNLAMLETSGTEILLIRTESTQATITIQDYTYQFGALQGQPPVTLTYLNADQGNCVSRQEFLGQGNVRHPAAIVCNGHLTDSYDGTTSRLRASQYTIVHELGHLFDYRTLDGLSGPINPGTFLLVDCAGATVMQGGFTRGRRGWGTGPQAYSNASQSITLITNFQQNPASTAIEAAADSFLNWVYRLNASGGANAIDTCTLTPTPPPTHWGGPGYRNSEWSATPAPAFVGNSNGLPGVDDVRLPGDRRYFDFDTRIRSIFIQYGW